MPWKNGNYVVSVYTNNELPTWNEVYEEFYKGQYYLNPDSFDNDKLTQIDLYWKIPRWKVLVAICCNEFNKCIHEDEKFPDYKDMMVMASDWHWLNYVNRLPIYSIDHPANKEDIFIIANEKVSRISVNKTDFDRVKFIFRDGKVLTSDDDEFHSILDKLIYEYKDYFENGVGWKDKDGKLIKSKNAGPVCPSGYDPAL